MISKRLVKAIEKNASKLAVDLVHTVRNDRRAEAYKNLSDAQFQGVVIDLYSNLGQWLQSHTWHKLRTVYERKGRERFHGDLPLEQLVFSLTTTKTLLLDFIRGSLSGDASERDLETELILAVSEFFDRAIYHTIVGYEDGRRTSARAAEKRAAEPPKPEAAKKRAAPRPAKKPTTDEDDHISRGGTIGETAGSSVPSALRERGVFQSTLTRPPAQGV